MNILKRIFLNKESVLIDDLLYHRYRFSMRKNLNVLVCRVFGHRLNDNPSFGWCGCCGLAYEEIYYRKTNAEIVNLDKDKQGKLTEQTVGLLKAYLRSSGYDVIIKAEEEPDTDNADMT